jgi:hypothetical protein
MVPTKEHPVLRFIRRITASGDAAADAELLRLLTVR